MYLLHRMQSGPLQDGGVAEALVLGWKADIDRDTKANYRNAGLAHLLAVSGLHVGLLAGMVGILFWWTGRERKGRIVRGSLQLMAVWLFALITGMAPSTMRAALMFSIFIVNDMVGRRVVPLNLLALVAIVMLLADPLLIYNIGWQLSFSAVAGILLAQPAIRALHSPFGQAAAVSIAATLATMPVVVATFHRLPLYFLVANVIVVPIAGVILGLSLLYMILPCAVTAWPLQMLLKGTDTLTEWVGSLHYAVAENVYLSTPLLVALVLVVVALLLLPQFFIRRGV
ncbi:MAG: ComEC/Rec2 family competence protein [Bacteroidales bacterium]|nr:ComEC/Rec2 family competence protein [Bacteroidales bacterium]